MGPEWVPRGALILAATVAACGGDGAATDGPRPYRPWQGSTSEATTADGAPAELVANTDGSVWQGAGRLVPEATIGVAEGAPELMFGRIADFALTDEHIYVLESQPPVIRKYDHDGRWIADLGRRGQGPGELDWPTALTVDEVSGRIWVEGKTPTRITVLGTDGGTLEPAAVDLWRGADDLTVTQRGLARTVTLETSKEPPYRRRLALEWIPADGGPPVREPLPVPDDMPPTRIVECAGGGAISTPVPFAPDFHWALLEDGGWVSGTSDAYRFTLYSADGSPPRIVERYWSPVPVEPDEAAWRSRQAQGGAKCNSAATELAAPDMPSHKRAYDDLFEDGAGRIWVVREGPGEPITPCAEPGADWAETQERPCWSAPRLIDVFAADGRYLGPLEAPDELLLSPRPVASGNRLLGTTLDAAGIYRLTWYRLEIPQPAT